MPTTRLIQPHFRTLSGMDATTPPHLVGDDRWIFLSGMRPYYGKLVQLPRITQVANLQVGGFLEFPRLIFNLPLHHQGYSYLIAFSGNGAVFRVKTEDTANCLSLASLSAEPGQGSSFPYWGGTVYNNQIWFVAPTSKLRSTDGASVKQYGIIQYPGNISVAFTTKTTTITTIIPGNNPTPVLSNVNVDLAGFGGSNTMTFLSQFFAPIVQPAVAVGQYVQLSGQTSFFRIVDVYNISLGGTLATIASFAEGFGVRRTTTVTIYPSLPTQDTTVTNTVTETTIGDTATFTSTSTIGAQFRVLAGQKVCLRGFQNEQFNGEFVVIDTPTVEKFTFKLRENPGSTVDPNTGTMEFCDISDVPSARYIMDWFDHLVIANLTYKGVYEPSKVRISDLYRPDQWEPTAENEADEFDMVISQPKSAHVTQVTGMDKINDNLYVYTTGAISLMSYVGLPKVIQVRPIVEEFGCQLDTLISNGQSHFFFDSKWFNFYKFDGSSVPVPIGDAVVGLLGSPESEPAITAHYVDYARGEVSWAFGSNLLVYNWASNSWYVTDSVSSSPYWPFGGSRPESINDVVATVDSFAPQIQIDQYDALNDRPNFRLYGGATSTYRALPGGTTLLSSILMETKDFTTDLQRVLEVDRITIHADYTTSSGIDIYVSARTSIQSPLNYKLVGRWTKNTVDGIVSFKPMPGRIFRYKFVPTTDTDGLVFYSFTDNVFNVLAER